MNCSYYEQVTDAYLSGQIDNPQWRKHLTECPACAAKVREEGDFDLLIRLAVDELRPGFPNDLAQDLEIVRVA